MFPFRLRKRPQPSREPNQFRPQLEPLEQRWVPTQSGTLAMMSAGIQDATIFILSNHDAGLTFFNGSSTTTSDIGGGGTVVQVSAGTDAGGLGVQIYALLTTGDIWTEDLGAASPATTVRNLTNCGCASQVSAGYDGEVAGVALGKVWVLNVPGTSNWTQVGTPAGGVRQISMGLAFGNSGNELWILNGAGNLYVKDVSGATPLGTLPFTAGTDGLSRFLTAGVNGEAFTIENGHVFQYNDSTVGGTDLTKTGSFGDAIEIAAGSQGTAGDALLNQVVIARNDGEVWRFFESGTGRAGTGHTFFESGFSAVHVGADNLDNFAYTDTFGDLVIDSTTFAGPGATL